MNTIPLWAQIVIALISSGLFGAIAGVLAARQQVKQLEITYRQKLNDNLLQNTRQYIDTLYIPINIRLTKLEDCYALYKSNKSTLHGVKKFRKDDEQTIKLIRKNMKQSLEDFLQAYKDYMKLMKEISDQGTDAYLTIDFNERLRSFTQFMQRASLEGWVLTAPEHFNAVDLRLEIDSIRFSRRFAKDIYFLQSYIKDITLGTAKYK